MFIRLVKSTVSLWVLPFAILAAVGLVGWLAEIIPTLADDKAIIAATENVLHTTDRYIFGFVAVFALASLTVHLIAGATPLPRLETWRFSITSGFAMAIAWLMILLIMFYVGVMANPGAPFFGGADIIPAQTWSIVETTFTEVFRQASPHRLIQYGLVCGGCLFYLRRCAPSTYGLLEIALATLGLYSAGAWQTVLSTKVLTMASSVYIVVRGVDNIARSIQDMKESDIEEHLARRRDRQGKKLRWWG